MEYNVIDFGNFILQMELDYKYLKERGSCYNLK